MNIFIIASNDVMIYSKIINCFEYWMPVALASAEEIWPVWSGVRQIFLNICIY